MDNEQHQLSTETGEQFEIPEEGSLGLLALGYEGLMLWRAKKKELQMKRQQENNAR
ncbi:MAG: hypothetical protein R2795_25975 [Saprospiraceae bacterium]